MPVSTTTEVELCWCFCCSLPEDPSTLSALYGLFPPVTFLNDDASPFPPISLPACVPARRLWPMAPSRLSLLLLYHLLHGVCPQIVDVELERLSKHLAAMRERLLELLMAADLGDGVKVHGPRNPSLRLPNTLSIGVPGVEARVLLERVRGAGEHASIAIRLCFGKRCI